MTDNAEWYRAVKLTSTHDPDVVYYVCFLDTEYPNTGRTARVSAAAGAGYVAKMVQIQPADPSIRDLRGFAGYVAIAFDNPPLERPDVEH